MLAVKTEEVIIEEADVEKSAKSEAQLHGNLESRILGGNYAVNMSWLEEEELRVSSTQVLDEWLMENKTFPFGDSYHLFSSETLRPCSCGRFREVCCRRAARTFLKYVDGYDEKVYNSAFRVALCVLTLINLPKAKYPEREGHPNSGV